MPNSRLRCSSSGLARSNVTTPAREASTVFVAVAESGLESRFRVAAGGGTPHAAVVRQLKAVLAVGEGQQAVSAMVPVMTEATWNRQNLSVVAFVQGNRSREIFGAAKLSLGDTDEK